MEWKNSPVQNSALLIEGARRVGKSTIVEEFAKNEFSDYLIIDFRAQPSDVKDLFNDIRDLDAFYRQLFLSQNHVVKPGGLIVFDEVQFCPKAREGIKDFVKDGRFRFIETGSLMSIKENAMDIMIPSEERRIDMHPMDFEEFLWAVEGNDAMPMLMDILRERGSIEEGLHRQYMEKYRTYLLLGGMPKVLDIFLSTSSFLLARQEQLDILKLYRDDLRKHDNKYGTVCGMLFDAIPSQLASDSRRFALSKIPGKKRFSQIKGSVRDLLDYRIVNIVYSVSAPELPLSFRRQDGKFKLYFCDIGLLLALMMGPFASGINEAIFGFIKGKKCINLGPVYESVAVQQLAMQGKACYYHRFVCPNNEKGKQKGVAYEIDLLVERDFKVVAIEIKSALHYKTASLDHLKSKYPQLKFQKYVFGVKKPSYSSDVATFPIYGMQVLQ